VKNQNLDSWEQVLYVLTHEQDFLKKVKCDGYFLGNRPFKEFSKKYGFKPRGSTPEYLSLDFWSQQSSILRDQELYLMRTGHGKFIILDMKRFQKPYLELDISKHSILKPTLNTEFADLINAFNARQENSGLEQLNILGIYDKLVKELFGNKKWFVGPRGGRHSKFKVYANDAKNEKHFLYDFDGQEELDYTIWTNEHILLFEAKSLSVNKGLDIGWHKLAYTASRFRKYTKYKIIPVYFLKWSNVVHLFVFPQFKFCEDGIVLNDKIMQKPQHVFKVPLSKTVLDF
jgi:hypothetical protein